MTDRPLTRAQETALVALLIWNTSSQHVPQLFYRAMRSLEGRGLVAGTGRGRGRDHALTDAGRREAERIGEEREK